MAYPSTPATPPHWQDPACHLLTPPPSGRFPKRVRFSEEEEDDKPAPKRLASTENFENLSWLSGFRSFSNGQTNLSPTEEGGAMSSVAGSSDSSLAVGSFEKHDGFAAMAMAIDTLATVQPFEFLSLPLKTRIQVYEELLTVPALICVHQRRTATYNEPGAYVFAENRELLPGIAFVTAQTMVDGMKSRFFRHPFVNVSILRVSKKVHAEAKEVLFGCNEFALANLNKETDPVVNWKVRLFPRGYQHCIRKVTLRANAIYGFRYILRAGHQVLKNHYRGIETLTLILELESVDKGYGRKFARMVREKWASYVKRVHAILQLEIFECEGISKSIPTFINLKVLFPGNLYVEGFRGSEFESNCEGPEAAALAVEESHLKSAISEAFELLKKGNRM